MLIVEESTTTDNRSSVVFWSPLDDRIARLAAA